MADNRHVQMGHDAQGNVIVTGNDNRVYVFPGVTELAAELLAHLQNGVCAPQEAPGAVPLPTLTLRITTVEHGLATWVVTAVSR